MLLLLIASVFCTFLIIIYLWITKDNNYWKKKGVKYVEPHLFVGNMVGVFTKKTTTGAIINDAYSKYANEPYIGMFDMRKPILLIRNLDLARDVLVTHFTKFHDNTILINEDTDPTLAKNPFFLTGERWKDIRAQLTPLLTVAKVRAMFPLIEENCNKLTKYIEANLKTSNGVDAKDFCLKFTTDNVASCGFGLEGNSFDESKAELKKIVNTFFNFTFTANIKLLLIKLFPELVTVFKTSITVREISDKFKAMIVETAKYRQENNVVRNDYLDSIIAMKSKPLPYEFTDDYLVAHAMTLLFDGSDTSAALFNYVLFELAMNPDIQTKLRNEIDLVSKQNNGKVTFDAILNMPYLEAVFTETLRKYPPLIYMSRICSEDYSIPRDSQEPLLIEKGSHVYIPTLAFHKDPQYYPDPERFDPDRFTENAKYPLPKNCYFGFGEGPRICIGRRFANIQIKAGIVTILKDYEIRLNKKTKLPLEFDMVFILTPKDKIWVDFYKRKE